MAPGDLTEPSTIQEQMIKRSFRLYQLKSNGRRIQRRELKSNGRRIRGPFPESSFHSTGLKGLLALVNLMIVNLMNAPEGSKLLRKVEDIIGKWIHQEEHADVHDLWTLRFKCVYAFRSQTEPTFKNSKNHICLYP